MMPMILANGASYDIEERAVLRRLSLAIDGGRKKWQHGNDAAPCNQGSGSHVPGELRYQGCEIFHCRKSRKTVNCRNGHPGQLFARIGLNKRLEPRRILQHRWAHVHELVKAVWPCKHPSHAMRTKEMTNSTMQSPDNGRAARNFESSARHHRGQGIRAGAHLLAASAMTCRCHDRWLANAKAYLPAPAFSVPR